MKTELSLLDEKFLERFKEMCKTSQIGSTELMIYLLGKELISIIKGIPIENIPEVDIDKNFEKLLPPVSTGTPMPKCKPPKEKNK